MQDQKDLNQKLRDLESLRQQALQKASASQGTVRKELQKVATDIEAEIAELKRQLGEA